MYATDHTHAVVDIAYTQRVAQETAAADRGRD